MNFINALVADVAVQPDETNAKLAINITTFLAICCWIFLLLFIVSRFNPGLRKQFCEKLGNYVFVLLALVPTVAMCFSLYFSEGLNWLPCKLCLYQRMCIYPLAFIGIVYYFWRNKWLRRLGYIFACICPFISIYHINLEIRGDESSFCSAEVSCATVWFKSLGFLTTPGMALTASLTTLVLLYLAGKHPTDNSAS